MPPVKPSIERLPADLRKELSRRIVEEDYERIIDLCQWIESQGFAISKTAMHRYKLSLAGYHPLAGREAAIPTQSKEPGNMTRAELERENGYLSAHLAQLSAQQAAAQKRQAAVQNELIRHMGGIPAMPSTASAKPMPAPCPIADKAKRIDAVKAALLAREPVDQVEANRRGWGLRLAALVHKLQGQGWPVRAERDHGNGMARYSLPEGWEPPNPTPDAKKPLRASQAGAGAFSAAGI